MRLRTHVVAGILIALLAGTGAGAQAPSARTTPRPARSGGPPPVAMVGSMRIEPAELDARMNEARQAYRDYNRAEVDNQLEPLLRRQVLENLIRQRLLTLDGRRRGVTVNDAEADAEMRRDPTFQRDGVFNEAKYLAIRSANPTQYTHAIKSIKEQLIARKLRDQLERETRPDDAAIKGDVERRLSRASIECLALRRKDFESGAPEPREAEILAYYAAHLDRFQRPQQATVSTIIVKRPSAIDSVDASDAGFRIWDQRTRARADSAIVALRAGATFADLAPLHGGMKAGIAVRRDRLPEFWNGNARDLATVFAAAPGTVLSEPVRSGSGWAVVRVDEVAPARVAPLREVARDIRRDLRAQARARRDEVALRAIYQAAGDSLRGDGYRLRYALADSASYPTGEPTVQDLDRYYRSHLADYMSYNRVTGAVVEKPLEAVRDEIRARWLHERREQLTRAAAERVRDAWSRGRRDAVTERSLAVLREIGPVPAEGALDTGRVAVDLPAALASFGGRPGVTLVPSGPGFLVVDLREVVPRYLPTFEQARPLLEQRLAAARVADEEAAARKMFEDDPSNYRKPGTLMFTRAVVAMPELLDVPLTWDEVDRFYRVHLSEYSVEEVARVRHILVSPLGTGPEADAVARDKAEAVLKRVRAGEDFVKLAAEFSDDPATRENGGDVGVFRHGQMRETFERAAFAMRPGDIIGPVRTDVGYHIMECLEYLPPVVHPLVEVYANVAQDCARRKAERIGKERADSLYRTLRNVDDAKALARRLDLLVLPSEHELGRLGLYGDDLLPYIEKLEKIKPGHLYPGTQIYQGLGTVITWVDSIAPARIPSWPEAREQVLQRYRGDAGQRGMLAKKAELDSMEAAGWSVDSLATLWGGYEISSEATAGGELRGLGGRALLDSLAFGRERAPALPMGQRSPWIEFPGGYARLKIVNRLAPDPTDFAKRMEIRRQIVLWRNLNGYFDRLKARYPVEIYDGELRATALPEPTEP